VSAEVLREFLREVFEFLERNRYYNEHTQHHFYRQTVGVWDTPEDKVIALLRAIAMTRANGSIGAISRTWQRIHADRPFQSLVTVTCLANALMQMFPPKFVWVEPDKKPLEAIFLSLKEAGGFGDKTAALFVKAVVEIHRPATNPKLRFIEPFNVGEGDSVHLPVDEVIKFIFLNMTSVQATFDGINAALKNHDYTNLDMIRWDDLWFWGFITQKIIREEVTPVREITGSAPKSKTKREWKSRRTFELNLDRFWVIPETPKDKWPEVENAATQFLGILRTHHPLSSQLPLTPAGSRSS
jgi:hypothetical protein